MLKSLESPPFPEVSAEIKGGCYICNSLRASASGLKVTPRCVY